MPLINRNFLYRFIEINYKHYLRTDHLNNIFFSLIYIHYSNTMHSTISHLLFIKSKLFLINSHILIHFFVFGVFIYLYT